MPGSFCAIDPAPVNIGNDEKDHATDDCGDHYPVEQVDVIHNWRMLGTWLIMAQPCTWEVGCGTRMAALALYQKVLAQCDPCLWIIHFGNIVNSVTVCANRLIRGLVGKLFCKEFYVRPVKVSYIGVEHFCRYSIFIHDLWVSMAIRAQCGCAVAEGCSGWVADLVHPMTIGTGGHVHIALISESLAMHAGFILFVLITMTLCARLGNMQARGDGQLAALRADDTGLRVWVMAV